MAAAAFVMSATAQDTAVPTVGATVSPAVVQEGDPLAFSFSLTAPAPEGGLPVHLTLVRDTDPEPGDVTYNVEGGRNIDGFEVIFGDDGFITGAVATISAGATGAVMLAGVTDDEVTEGPEYGTFELAAGDGYTVDPERDTLAFTLED
jgi:hypothetical protein